MSSLVSNERNDTNAPGRIERNDERREGERRETDERRAGEREREREGERDSVKTEKVRVQVSSYARASDPGTLVFRE